ncbi:MAG: hypothetical protein MUE84_13525 [Hyphomonas sp.]|nr:hypothetical protein [Hyphomonas sp.]
MSGAWAGAALGALLGLANALVIGGAVAKALEATDRSATEAERQDYGRRVRLFRRIVPVVFIAGGAFAGYGLGGWLFG